MNCLNPWPDKARTLLLVMLTTSLLVAAGASEAAAEAEPSWDQDLGPVSIVTSGWVDVREILRNIATNTDLGLQMAPDVTGKVNIHLENVPVSQALTALLEPVNLGFEVMGGVLVVHKRGMVTRWFPFDYPVTLREGRGELEISAGSEESSGGGQSSGSGGGEGSGSNQNKSHVTSTATMSVWPEVMNSLKVLVFQGVADNQVSAQGTKDQSVSLSDPDGRSLVVNPMASLVQVTAEFDRVHRVEELLAHLQESLQRQVAIEVRIMEVSLDKDTQTGVNWTTIPGKKTEGSLNTLGDPPSIGENFFQFVVNSGDVTGVMQAVATSGSIKSVSTPRVTTLNNQKAVVRVVREDIYYEAQVEPAVISNGVATDPVINYTPRSVSIGVVLDVTPQVARDGTITLNVHPTISDVVGIAESPNLDTAPILSIRELDTVGKVQAGQTLVIAGLMSERSQLTRTGVPLLKDLPLLGYLFGKTHQQKYNIELVMLLTPVLLDGNKAAAVAEAELEKMMGKM
jgi:MSHA biogenesis protein MshL